MQLTPRYDGPPVIAIEVGPQDMAVPVMRQRRRLQDLLATFGEEQWAHQSRCAEWRVQDVVTHLWEVNTFWTYSIQCGLNGEPTRFLATFDPVASPAKSVGRARDRSTAEVFTAFAESNDGLAATLDSLDDDGWNTVAEAPLGHIAIRALACHALWDGWIHERDIA